MPFSYYDRRFSNDIPSIYPNVITHSLIYCKTRSDNLNSVNIMTIPTYILYLLSNSLLITGKNNSNDNIKKLFLFYLYTQLLKFCLFGQWTGYCSIIIFHLIVKINDCNLKTILNVVNYFLTNNIFSLFLVVSEFMPLV